jgi:superfamily I DNA/RNA helicase/RecB family exonuclease
MPETTFRLSRVATAYLAGQDSASVDTAALAPVLALSADSVATVVGAPGAGKTFALAEWVKSAVRAGRHPDSILVIAANRTAATVLRDNLALALQTATGGALARSLNSFAFGLLHSAALKSGNNLPTLISGSEQDRILAQILAEIDPATTPFTALTLGLAGFRAEVRDTIAVIQEHQLTAEQLRVLATQHDRVTWAFAADVYDRYLAMVAGPEFDQRFEPSTLLHRARDLVKLQPELLDEIDVVLVDDSQELTPAAVKFLSAVVEAKYSLESQKTYSRGLLLFGDPDVSTLGFRAADPQTMALLTREIAANRGQSARVVTLEPTRQARPAELNRVLARISSSIDTALGGTQRRSLSQSQTVEAAGAVETVVLRDRVSEISWLARRLRELHLFEGVEWADIAVVARSRGELGQLETALASESVPTRVAGAATALRDEFASRALLRIAQAVLSDEPVTLELATELLASPYAGLDNLAMRRLRRVLRRQELDAEGTRNGNELIADLFLAAGSAATLENPEGRKANRFIKTFFEAKTLVAKPNFNIEELLWLIFDSSKIGKTWQALSEGIGDVALQANRNLDAVTALFAAANRYVERDANAPAKDFIENQLALGLPEDSLAVTDRSRQTIQLLTPAGLIGRRFKVVCIPALIEGAWPNLRPRSTLLGANVLDGVLKNRITDSKTFAKSELPDELRLLQKAVGAAEQKLIVTSHLAEDNQISQFVTLINGEVPATTSFEGTSLTLRALSARFRRDLAQSYTTETADSAAVRGRLTMGLAKMATAGVAGSHPDSWYGLMPLSSESALYDLNDESSPVYLRPSDIDNFLKCPLHWFINAHGGKSSSFEASLGSIVHKAVELATGIDEAELLKTIDTGWQSLTFEADWVEQIAKRKAVRMVQNALEYLTDFEQSGGVVIGREVPFSFKIDHAVVNGKVDRIEQLADGRIMIVDLKTGTYQTGAKDAKEHPQLLMYQLAYENGAFDECIKKSAMPETIVQMGMGEIVRPPLAGAQLWVIADDNVTNAQDSIETNTELHGLVDSILEKATEGMASNFFVAKISSHCNNDQANKFASCSIHLVKPVSYVA